MTELMYTPLESVFASTMEREGRVVTAYTSGEEFQAFMRRNDDGNNTEDRITLYYAINAPVEQGNLISYGNKIYLLLNRETEENNCYYKSSGLACNGKINLNDGTITGIPCYAYDLNNGLSTNGQTISVISGDMEFVTEDNALGRQIEINDTFNEFGRTWNVKNIYYKDGMLHLITEVHADVKPVENLSIAIDGIVNSRTYGVGTALKVQATLYINNTATTGTIQWESTDPEVATVDDQGNVEFINAGSVSIEAHWIEKDYTESVLVNVSQNVSPTGYYATLESDRDYIQPSFSREVTAHLYCNGEEVTGTWEFTTNITSSKDISTEQTGNVLKITIESSKYIGSTLTITARDINQNVTAIFNMKIVSLY